MPSFSPTRRSWVRTLLTAPVRRHAARTLRRGTLCVEPLEDRSVPAAITGLVFEDFNANGVFDNPAPAVTNADGTTISAALDVGLANVTVTAYTAAGAVAATGATIADGTYSLTVPTTGTYRIEFTNLPAGFGPGPHGGNSYTTVQFAAGGTGNNSLGLVRPSDYSPNDPNLASVRYIFGDQVNGANKAVPVVLEYPYSAGGTANDTNTPTPTGLATAQQIGTVFGLASSRASGLVYAAAYTKLHTGYGPAVTAGATTYSGNGSIYAINPATGAVGLLANLNQLFGAATAGTDFRAGYAAGDTPYTNDSVFTANAFGAYTSWDAVGKSALGGMAVSDDGSTLYVMNLANRRLYAIPLTLGRAVTAADVSSVSIPLTAPGATGANGADLRPFAVTYYRGQVYVGIVNSAESTITAALPQGDATKLRAYVYQVNPANLTFGTTPVFQITDLTYGRDYAARFANDGVADWHPWTPYYQNVSGNGLVYAQPMLSGIAFDAAGNITLGFRDRAGDQGGDFVPVNPTNQGLNYETFPAGETLRAFGSPAAGWTLENNGTGPGGTPAGNPLNSPYGPGTGQFYQQDYGNGGGGHGYTDVGGVAQLPGFPDVVVSAYDPFEGGAYRTGGTRFNSNTTGVIDKAFQLYYQDQPGTFGKANGIGDVVAVLPPAPVEIGNRVWADANANGIQDANEAGIQNVTVRLYSAAGALLGTATTDAGGNYYFNASNVSGGLASNTTYSVRVDLPANYTTGPLAGLIATRSGVGADAGIDSNGVPASATDTRAAVLTGALGTSDHGYDFGFTTSLALGNVVYDDANNNGAFDTTTEAGLNGVTVALLDSAGNAVLDAAGVPRTTTTATVGGVAGYYQFTGLLPGTYRVRLSNLPAGYVSSTGNPGSATGAFEPGSTTFTDAANNTDHGTQDAAGGTVTSQPVTLTAPTTNPDANPAGVAGAANENVDLGVFRPLSLGDTVWNDANNDGLLDNGEAGVNGVVVDLLDSAGNALLNGAGAAITATTAGTGAYLFTNLGTGTYRVRLDASNFAAGGALAGFRSSTGAAVGNTTTGALPYEPGSTTYTAAGNNTDHGTNDAVGLGVTSQPVTLTAAGTNPNTVGAVAGGANLGVDLGVFRPLSLGNFVWADLNNNGVFNAATEAGLPNVAVSLLNATGGVAAQTTTTAAGYYLFTDLAPGAYTVRIDAANFAAGGALAGYASSTGTVGAATGPYESATAGLGGDNTDHGTTQTTGANAGAVLGQAVTLSLGGETTGQPATPGITDPASDGSRDVTQDFGFFRPLSLGDFVFSDPAATGTYNPATDSPIAGATVALLDGNGTPLLNAAGVAITTTTNGAGAYSFTNLIPGSYRVRVTPPTGYFPDGTAAGTFTDATNNTNHGTRDAGAFSATSAAVTLGAPGAAANPDAAGTANTNVDFGFHPTLALGNFVWTDSNNNGVFDPATEAGRNGVTVTLLDAATGLRATDAGGAAVADLTTATVGGVAGSYLFTNLNAGTYLVRLSGLPAGTVSSTGAVVTNTSAAPYPYEPGSTTYTDAGNNTDHGTEDAGGTTITSRPVTLGAFGTNPDAGGAANTNVDFGVFPALSLGNFVWADANNNGRLDGTEAGIGNVAVSLLNATGGVAAQTTTTAAGYYLFTDLTPGAYTVRIDAANFAAGGALAGYASSTGTVGAATGPYEPIATGFGSDTFDHGTTQTTGANAGAVLGTAVSLTVGGETTGQPATPGITDPASDGSRDVTQDFGFFRPLSLGDFVFSDPAGTGTYNPATDSPVVGATVALLDGNGTPLLNAAGVAITTTTNGAGAYSFTNLIPGSYRVRVTPPVGLFPDATVATGFGDATNNTNHGTRDAGAFSATSAAVTLGTVASGTNPDGSGTANTNVDFGFHPTLALGNFVWTDANNNGVFDPASEAGLNGVTVTLLDAATGARATDAGGVAVPDATTATVGGVAGSYLFTNLAPGTYLVRLGNLPAGFVSSTGAILTNTSTPPYPSEPGSGTYTDAGNNTDHGTEDAGGTTVTSRPVTLTAGGNPDATGTANTNVDFGVFQPASLGDRVFLDANGNGIQDGTEAGVNGVTVQLLDSTGQTVLATTTTTTVGGVVGSYSFGGLPAGTYRVKFGTTSGTTTYALTAANQGTNPGLDSNADPATGLSGPVTLAAGGADPTIDAGVYVPLAIGDTVFLDHDDNGLQGGTADAGVDGVTVNLYYAGPGGTTPGATPIASQTTANGGRYLFPNLAPGVYQVEFVAPTGYAYTTANAGTDPTANSKADPATGRTGVLTEVSGTDDLNQDAGLVRLATLSGHVYVDLNNNGVFDAGEPPIGGVSVTLTGTDDLGQPVSTTVPTDPTTGAYSFPGLRPGTYTITEAQPGGYLDGKTAAGTERDLAGNPTGTPSAPSRTAATSTVSTITLVEGTTGLNNDFGELRPASVNGFTYVDANNDGVKDPTETPITGVTVTLTGTDDLGAIAPQTFTLSPDGDYHFTGLRPGTYTLTENQPTGYLDGKDTPGTLFGGAAGTTPADTLTGVTVPGTAANPQPAAGSLDGQNYNFGELIPAGIAGTVYFDGNADRAYGGAAPDQPLSPVTVTLTGTNDLGQQVTVPTTTAADGTYSFPGLRPGTYTVTVTPPNGYIPEVANVGTVSGTPDGTAGGATAIGSVGISSGNQGVTYNFGLVGAGVSGTVFIDTSRNGRLDGAETGIPTPPGPVTLTLTDSNGVQHTTTTGPGGGYSFTNIPPGAFTIVEAPPAGLLTTSPTTLTGTQTAAGVTGENFGLVPGGLSGVVYFDQNASSGLDGTDPRLPGVRVTITGARGGPVTDIYGNVVGPATTGADGSYSFPNLPAGTYTITETQPAGYAQGTDTLGTASGTTPAQDVFTVTLPAGALGTGYNYGERGTAIGNTVFIDANNNGRFDPTETGLAGVTVQLINPATGAVLSSQQTAAGGQYLFTDLPPGSYQVRVVIPAGYVSSTGAVVSNTSTAPYPFEPGNSDTTDAGNNADHGTTDAGGTTVTSVAVATAAGTDPDAGPTGPNTANLNLDFGLFRPLSIGDTVWLDANNDGVRQATEAAARNVAVSLLDANGNVLAATRTNAQGGYLFTDLTPGTYRVRIDAANFATGGALAGTTSSTGTNGAAAGPYEPAAGTTGDNTDHGTTQPGTAVLGGLVNLQYDTQPTGETPTPGGIPDPAANADGNHAQDFGFYSPLSVGDQVFYDANNNGRRDPGEAGVGGVTVRLVDAAGAVVGTTTTDTAGHYEFNGLVAGRYLVALDLPAGYSSSSGVNGLPNGPFEPGLAGTDLTNDADHGTAAGGVGSLDVTKLFDLLPAGQNPDAGGTANLRQDFGIYQPLSVGDFVWNDVNNNGVADPGEAGLGGVKVELLDAAGAVVATTATTAQGGYLFTYLAAGTYQVRVTTPAGYASSTGRPGSTSGPAEPAANDNANNRDKGTASGAFALGGPVVLRPGTQPTGDGAAAGGLIDPAPDANGNHTQDFGFVAIAVDLAVTITADNPRVTLGDPNTFTITVTNNGPGTATGTVTSVIFPPGLVPVSGAPSQGSYDPATGMWNVGTLPAGGTVFLRVTARVNTPGPVSPTAVVSADQTETTVANNVASTPVTAQEAPGQSTKRDFLSTTAGPAAAGILPTALPAAIPASRAVVATGAGPGAAPLVEVWDRATGQLRSAFLAYDAGFTGGVNVAVADVNRDGVLDVITAPQSGGGPNVRVFDGRTGGLLASFFAFEPSFTGGVNLAAGDVDGDGAADIVAGAGVGGAPRVVVFKADGTPVSSLYAYDASFRDGVTVAAGDLDGDGRAEVVAGSGAGGGPNVKAFDGLTGAERLSFFAFDPSFRGGVLVAAGDTDGTGRDSILAAPGTGGGPLVGVFDGRTGAAKGLFTALAADFRGGVRVAAADVDGDGRDDLIATPETGGGPAVSTLDAQTGRVIDGFYAFDPSFAGGVNVAAADKPR